MVNAFVSSRFKLSLPDIKTDFQVLAFKGQEVLDQPFFIQVQVVSENPSLDLESLLHQPAYAFCNGNTTDFKPIKMPDGRICDIYPTCTE